MFGQTRFVYVLRSAKDSTRYYTGATGNGAQRLAKIVWFASFDTNPFQTFSIGAAI